MASDYLKSQLLSLSLKPTYLSAIESSTSATTNLILVSLTNFSLVISDKRQRFKVKTAKPPKPEETPQIKPAMDKKARDELFKEHNKKAEESKEFTKKLVEERAERQKRIQEREREYRMKTLQEIEEQKKRQEEIILKMEEDRVKRVAEAQQKSVVRKKQIEEVKVEIKKAVSTKPLFKQMEDQYKQQVLMPQLEKHKAELAKKRIMYHPIDPEELKEHSRKHEEIKREQQYRRNKEKQQKLLEAQVNYASANLHSKFTVAVLDEQKKLREDQEKAKEEKLLMINKRLQYAKLVKEMFPPIVNEFKRESIENNSRFDRNLRSAMSRDISAGNSVEKKKIQVSDYKSDIGSVPKRVWKKNPLIPEPKKEKIINIKDYLAEKRNIREQAPKDIKPIHIDLKQEIEEQAEIDDERVEKIRAKAEYVDKQAKIQERLIGSLKDNGYKGIEAGDQVNDMIITSIKAKLALLDKFNSK